MKEEDRKVESKEDSTKVFITPEQLLDMKNRNWGCDKKEKEKKLRKSWVPINPKQLNVI